MAGRDADPERARTAAHRSPTATPRWVKAFAIVALVLVVTVLVMLVSGGNHGPGRHLDDHAPSSGHRGDHAPATGRR
ncbi:MAG: hypothetical protein M3296_00065 [Actinomycetota bacterium]|nr:hypothetical protein [Actinomycetota bacterium]